MIYILCRFLKYRRIAFTNSGGREFYKDARRVDLTTSYQSILGGVTAGTAAPVVGGRPTGILHIDTDATTYLMRDGNEITITPSGAHQIIPIIPAQIKHNADANSHIFVLY